MVVTSSVFTYSDTKPYFPLKQLGLVYVYSLCVFICLLPRLQVDPSDYVEHLSEAMQIYHPTDFLCGDSVVYDYDSKVGDTIVYDYYDKLLAAGDTLEGKIVARLGHYVPLYRV